MTVDAPLVAYSVAAGAGSVAGGWAAWRGGVPWPVAAAFSLAAVAGAVGAHDRVLRWFGFR